MGDKLCLFSALSNDPVKLVLTESDRTQSPCRDAALLVLKTAELEVAVSTFPGCPDSVWVQDNSEGAFKNGTLPTAISSQGNPARRRGWSLALVSCGCPCALAAVLCLLPVALLEIFPLCCVLWVLLLAHGLSCLSGSFLKSK